MKDYPKIARHCQANSRYTKVIDEFLIYYAAQREKLEPKMDRALKKYRHVARKLPTSTVNIMKSAYISTRLFRKGGLIGKYLNHSAVKKLPPDEYNFLKFQHQHPWRFSFSIILERPAADFFKMLDVFTDEEYLLYSPGINETLQLRSVYLWFNLIAFNGECWQTYGTIIGFSSFTPNDLLFFANELDPDLENEEDMMQRVEKNPWPFFMLAAYGNAPLVMSKGEPTVYYTALDEGINFPHESLKDIFSIKSADEIHELKLDEWSVPPHFAKAYYDEIHGDWFRFATTESGFSQLTEMLRQAGVDVNPEPHLEVTAGMMLAAQAILREDIELDPYEILFAAPDQGNPAEMEKLNRLLDLAMPSINKGESLDFKTLAAESGVDPDTAKDFLSQVQERIQQLRDGI
jgi:hypothetical protein